MKFCNKCNISKPLTEFPFDNRRNNHSSPCKKCRRILAKPSDGKWRKENPGKARLSDLKTKLKVCYGITPERRLELWNEQNGLCAICKNIILIDSEDKATKAHVDHCHVSLVVRGLLCLTCNTGIGMLNDSIDLLDAAKVYLQSRGASTVKSKDPVTASVSADLNNLN